MRDGLLSQAVPAALTREGRLLLLQEAAEALIAGRAPSRESALFVGGALQAWLQDGLSPFEKHARVSAPRGSHRTVRAVLAEFLIGDEGANSSTSLKSKCQQSDPERKR